jgi:4-hydroxyphenylpyruvate dioxygenase
MRATVHQCDVIDDLPVGGGTVRTMRLSLHTWTLDTTSLDEVLRIATATGWEAVELRRVDFIRAARQGQRQADVVELVRNSGLPVSAVGAELGWMFATGDEHRRLLTVFEESCQAATALRAPLVMSPVDMGRGSRAQAAARISEVGDIAAAHGRRLTLEFQSQAAQINSLQTVRELLAEADHPAVGLLLDTYHLERSGLHGVAFADVPVSEIFYVQFSDVPASGLVPGQTQDRLPPGAGVVPFAEIFALLDSMGYAGDASYEAPNPGAWERPAEAVAREALLAARRFLPARPAV